MFSALFFHGPQVSAKTTSGNAVRYFGGIENRNKMEHVWKRYLSPNHIEFWKEGDYTPPVPLILAMKNPNKDNIGKFVRYLDLRAKYQANFQTALRNYKRSDLKSVVIAVRSDCRACHELLKEVMISGYPKHKIKVLQIDRGNLGTLASGMQVKQIPASTRKSLNISVVPTVWIQSESKGLQRLSDPQQLIKEIY